MDALQKQKNKLLLSGIVVSLLFVTGIPGIPVFAGKNTFLMILSIVCVAVGFYAAPLIWVQYGALIGLRRTLVAVEEENLYTVEELALNRGLREKEIVGQVKKLMDKRYLKGYVFDGKELKLNQNQKLSEIKNSAKCPSCGANVVFGGKQGNCPYCGHLVNTK